jgi:hypothetical protein
MGTRGSELQNSELSTIRSFGSESEAMVARSALEAFGIDCTLSSDDCGGQRLHLAITEGIRLLVRAEDAKAAEEILSAPADEENN